MTLDIHSLMQGLAKSRPIFHSEADFQFELAGRIKESMPDCKVRMEFKPFPGEAMHLDIWLPTIGTVIELKYRTVEFDTTFDGERFLLTGQGGGRRYESVKDIARVELMVSRHESIHRGFAVLLTNAASYWNSPSERWKTTTDAAFRLHDGRKLCGELKWSDSASITTKEGREDPITLVGDYMLRWQDYSKFAVQKNGVFRYLAVPVSD